MLNVVCVKWGAKYGPAYVNILHDMVRRNLPAGYEGRFVCFTDDATSLHPDITVRGLPPGIEGWWNKLALFKSFTFPTGDRVLYLDLDTVITGKLDAIAAYDGPFAICRDFYRPDGLQSCVMAWEANNFSGIWDEWCLQGRPLLDGGDQAYIERYFKRHGYQPELWQHVFPGAVVSFKAHCQPHPPAAAVIVNFHGDPKPDNCLQEWVRMIWKVGGGTSKELREVCNVAAERIADNVRLSSRLPLPWLDSAPAHEGHAVIVGGGPSLKRSLNELKYRHSLGQTIIALNGAHRWLAENGIEPQMHVICDARPENEAFIDRSARSAFYLASACDPAVFTAAMNNNKAVTVFHQNTEGIANCLPATDGTDGRPVILVGGGSTVLLQSMVIAYVLGFRFLHLYGVDSCYESDAHHAYAQPLNDGETVLDVTFNNKAYRCAPWMVGQADQFIGTAKELAELDCTITVSGDGLIPDIARDLQVSGLPITAAEIRAIEILDRLPQGPRSGVEIGVFTGALSSRLLTWRQDLSLYMVDSWEGSGGAYADPTNDFHARLTQQQQDAYFQRTCQAVSFAGPRARVIRKRSEDAAIDFAPRAQDFVFIDADHSYAGAQRDIELWFTKVRPGGLLCGHDYAHPEFPGVKIAVDEFAAKHGYDIDRGENFTWFIRV